MPRRLTVHSAAGLQSESAIPGLKRASDTATMINDAPTGGTRACGLVRPRVVRTVFHFIIVVYELIREGGHVVTFGGDTWGLLRFLGLLRFCHLGIFVWLMRYFVGVFSAVMGVIINGNFRW